MSANQVIIVGGGLAGLSAAHSVIQHGGSVVVVDKSAFLGGNSTKATSGINGSYTWAQAELKIEDSQKLFLDDVVKSFHNGKEGPVSPLSATMVRDSGPAVDWLVNSFGIDLSVIGLMGGHCRPRTHRGKERFPGMTITYALMDALEKIEKATNGTKAKIITKARVVKLIREGPKGEVNGVVFVKDGQNVELRGPVIVASGGFGADFSDSSLLRRFRPDLMDYSTTNGDHCTGDGIKLAESVGADTVDMANIQVHPTGIVHPDEPNAKVKFLAAEALRGTGALVLNADGQRFMNEIGRRNYCSAQMKANKGPFRLILNGKCAKEIHWHCKHYQGRGLMKHLKSGDELAKEIGVAPAVLAKTFTDYTAVIARNVPDQFGKAIFKNGPWTMNDEFFVAIIEPIVHYTHGGIKVDEHTQVIGKEGAIPGLFAAGEVAGGIHGANRLGGNSLLDCVVYGRIAGRMVTKYLLETRLGTVASTRLAVLASQQQPAAAAPAAAAPAAPAAAAPAAAAAGGKGKKFTAEEVAKHNQESDVWVIVGKQVLDVTKFLPDHPGGKRAIMLYAGKDATEEFDMMHKREVIEKYAPESVIGEVA